jgi:SAM-dependent methyltransferase
MGDEGDFARRFVLDAPMLERVAGALSLSKGADVTLSPSNGAAAIALDVGCGEGRFCRLMQAHGLRTVGIDPTQALIERARERDPAGDYRIGHAETLDVTPGGFDLVVCYLSLIDIPDLARAAVAITRALRPGGRLLIANLTSFNTAGMPDGWRHEPFGRLRFSIDRYLEERAIWVTWRGIRVRNWHRPLSAYMTAFLDNGLELRHFAEPEPTGGDPAKIERYRRVPWCHVMEWQRPTS